MVSIQNPAVSISDIWSYEQRSLTNSTEVSNELINSLLNSVLGQEFDMNSVGYYLTKGIAQDVADITKNITPFTYSYIRPMTYSPETYVGFKAAQCQSTSGDSSWYGNTGNLLFSVQDPILNNIKFETGLSTGPVVTLIRYDPATCLNDSNFNAYCCYSTRSNSTSGYSTSNTERVSKSPVDDNTMLTWFSPSGSWTEGYMNDRHFVMNWNKGSGNNVTMSKCNLVNGQLIESLPMRLTLQNIQRSNINGVFLSFGHRLVQEIKGSLTINGTESLAIDLPIGTDYFATPSDWTITDISPSDAIQLELRNTSGPNYLVTPLKAFIVNSILTQPTT